MKNESKIEHAITHLVEDNEVREIFMNWVNDNNAQGKDIEVVFWDGDSYFRAERRLLIRGKVPVVANLLHLGSVYDDMDYNIADEQQ